MANLLVTGGAGFIGANFVRYWREHHPGDEIAVLDALTYAGNAASLAGVSDVHFVHGDIGNFDLVKSLLEDRSIDTLVHFAAESHVDRSIHGADAFVETNVLGTHTLLKAAKAVWLDSGTGKPHRFHHVSTDEVFGSLEPDDPPFTEATPYRPNSPYSATKAASDHLVRAYHQTYGLAVTASNCSNNYGPYQFPEKLIPLFIINMLLGRELPIYGDGRNVRDWLHVADHCRGIEAVLRKGKIGETYNIGGGEELANLEVIDRLAVLIDDAFLAQGSLAERFPDAPAARSKPSVQLKRFVTDRKGHDRRYSINCTKASAELGYEPEFGFEEGLRGAVDWYITNVHWWRSIMDGSYLDWIAPLKPPQDDERGHLWPTR